MEDEARAECPRTSQTVNNMEHVHAVLETDRRMSIRMLADDLNIDKETIWQIIMEDLGRSKGMCAFRTPHIDSGAKGRTCFFVLGLSQIVSN